MSATETKTVTYTRTDGTEGTVHVAKTYRVRNGFSVDTATGLVFAPWSDMPKAYVTERWMRNHGWIA